MKPSHGITVWHPKKSQLFLAFLNEWIVSTALRNFKMLRAELLKKNDDYDFCVTTDTQWMNEMLYYGLKIKS